MAHTFEEDIRSKTLLAAAERMAISARTAPKGRGLDNIVISIADKESITVIASKMKEMVEEGTAPDFFKRDANNILLCEVLVLIGTKINPLGIKFCGLCGFENCDEKNKYPNHPCSFNTVDLGIAIGSAVSVAMDSRVDNRVMYSVGKTVKELRLLGSEVKIIYGIPLSSTGKNPFFDRK